MFEFVEYTTKNKQEWNQLIGRSKNGTFLFHRDYMDYHSDRFEELSFLIYRKGKLEGVLPGNINKGIYFSHQGLTYGGLVITPKISAVEVLAIFDLLNNELKNRNIKEVIYKPTPYIYHRIPSQEDIFALFRNNAKKIGCNISSTIYQESKIKFIESRKSGIRKSKNNGVSVRESYDFDSFWSILNDNLVNKYGKNSVHTLEEINYLHSKFPNNIKLFMAYCDDKPIAGTVMFLMHNCVHVQYISASEEGKGVGALDLVFDYLINDVYTTIPIFDFGQSTEQLGEYLNESLIFQKEGFGGRGVVYDVYKYQL